MKTKTIAAYRLTTAHQLVLRDLDGVRKPFQITRIEKRPGICSGKPRITTWHRDSFGSETSAVWSPRGRAEIVVPFKPNGDQPLNPDLQTSWR